MDIKNELEILQQKIDHAEKNGLPLEDYVLRAIELLQNSLVTFKQNMAAQGRGENDTIIAELEIRQYSAMKQLAQKINQPTDKYDEAIKQVQIRIFGEENWENFFGN